MGTGKGRKRPGERAPLAAVVLVGGVVGGIVAARGPAVWWGPAAGLAAVVLLLGVDMLSRRLIAGRAAEGAVRRPTIVIGVLITAVAVVAGVLTAERVTDDWLGPAVGVGVFVLLYGLNALLGQAKPPLSDPVAPELVPAAEAEPEGEPEGEPEAVESRPAPQPVPKAVAVVFIHGLLSSARVWAPFRELIAADPELAALAVCTFEYPSSVVGLNPLQRIPDFDLLGRQLGTYLENDLRDYAAVVLVTHSQGGLVAQRHLALELNAGRGRQLARIKQLVMFACPNSGSELALTLRRLVWFWRHPQERQLRPLNAQVADAHRVIINRVIHARRVTPHECPIPIAVYAGAQDNVVTSTSAFSVLPHDQTGVLPGDHFSIVRPDSPTHSAYLTLRNKLLAVVKEHDPNRPAGDNGSHG